MKQSPLVSIIIPCHNTEKYISEAIASALDQTYPNVEVIVVDDGSTDRSLEIIQSFGDRLKYDQINHKGACAARNRGLEISKGEFIQFLDADDVLLPHKLEKQLPLLLSNQADLVFCNGYLFGDDRPQRPIKKLLALPSPDNIDPFIYCILNGFGTEGPLHRRSCLEKVKGFTEGLLGGQEYNLHIRLGAINARLYKLDDFLFKHRNHDDPNRITRMKKPPDFMLQMLINLSNELEENPDVSLNPERCKVLAEQIFKNSIYAYRNGVETVARKGFKRAKELSKNTVYHERAILKFLAQYIDIIFIEKTLNHVRRSRNYLRSLFS